MEHSHFHRGFTLIELLVVLAIITIITAVTFTSQGSFNKSIILTNTAYDVALSLRSAETYGIGSRVAGAASNAGYGLHFVRAAPSNFTLFADVNSPADGCHTLPSAEQGGAGAPNAMPGNCVYDNGETVTDYALGNGITVYDFCAYSSRWYCANNATYGNDLTSLDIVFARPNPDPFIFEKNISNNIIGPFINACITLSSRQGGFRFISVTTSGAITANAPSCP